MTTRRGFHEKIIYLLSSLITAALALPAAAYLLLPSRNRKQSSWVEVGNVADLPRDKPTELVFQRK
ncbi:MAG: ubiquinol-cytochrome c reductase iron-sulfur subunit, partial [bacterium]|nr:ubiquinol-cytochrome c reductase iron-sulfur subunit [bacterium]